jgi:hypothetical protein
MWSDPIIEEIHAVRLMMAQEAGFDLARICAEARAREIAYPAERLATSARQSSDDEESADPAAKRPE